MMSEIYLVLNEKGVRTMTKRKPKNIGRAEVLVLVKVEIDSKIFQRFAPVATLNITDTQVIEPVTISVDNAEAKIEGVN